MIICIHNDYINTGICIILLVFEYSTLSVSLQLALSCNFTIMFSSRDHIKEEYLQVEVSLMNKLLENFKICGLILNLRFYFELHWIGVTWFNFG